MFGPHSAFLVNPDGDVVAGNDYGPPALEEYAPGGKDPVLTVFPPGQPTGLAYGPAPQAALVTINATPSDAMSLGQSAPTETVNLSEPGYVGTFTVDSAACDGIATVSPGQGTSFTIAAKGAGRCALVFLDSKYRQRGFPFGVTSSTIVPHVRTR